MDLGKFVNNGNWTDWSAICEGSHMISSAFGINQQQIAFAFWACAIWLAFEKYTSADLSHIAREKSCD